MALGVGVAGLGQRPHDASEDEQAERDVEPERPPPAHVSGEPSAHEGADCGHAADRRTVDREGDRALPPTEEGVHARQGRRQDERRTDALDDAGGDEQVSALGRACPHRRHHEDHHAEREDAPPPTDVAEAPHGEQEGSEHQGIRRVEPFGLGRGQPEVADDDRQGDVDDRRVHDDERHPEGNRREGEPSGAGAAGW